MIDLKGVSKIYSMGKTELVALRNISFHINRGEFVAIVGPSGSGKSTLMHIIGGLDSTTMGRVLVDGEDISKLRDREISVYRNKKIGFVFQNFILENTQTALENVMLPLIFAGIPKKERAVRATKALEIVGLKDKINNRPNEMSGGERQRVGIARALVNEPELILADEPTGNLDSKTGKNIMNLFKKINKNGYTVVMVTHNSQEASQAKRIIEIMDGEITSEVIRENRG